MKKYKWISLVLIVLLAACSTSSKITSSWKAPDMAVRKYNKILEMALINEKDRSLQENMEKHLAGDLQNLGYSVITSLQEYGPKAFDKMDENTALDKLKNMGVDAVITIVLLHKRKEKKYVPGTMFYSPYGLYYNRFWATAVHCIAGYMSPAITLPTLKTSGRATFTICLVKDWCIPYKRSLLIPQTHQVWDTNMAN